MNIKNIVRSQTVRHNLLKLFSWLPDSIMLPFQYYLILHRRLNLKSPRRFSEKIQAYKAFYRNSDMLRCVDKYLVRDFVEERLGTDKYLNKLYLVCDRTEEIEFDTLPAQFVIKTTDGGNGNNIFICKDKSKVDWESVKTRIDGWKGRKLYNVSREWAYVGAKQSRIIVEKYLSEGENSDLTDYKFYCFNGEPHFCQLIQNRSTDETIDFYDMDWNHMPFCGLLPPNYDKVPLGNGAGRPDCFEEMKYVAAKLSEGFPFSRIDLYNIGGEIYFGEVTFYPASGYGVFDPDEWDFKLGDLMPNHTFMNK